MRCRTVQEDVSTSTQTMFVCQQMWPSEQLKRAYFLGVIVLSCYTVPLLLITVLYSLIGYRVWHRDAPGFANTSDVTTLTYLLCMCSQARRQEMKGGVFFVKKVDLSSTQGCIMYSISIFLFYILLIWGVRTHPTHPLPLPTGLCSYYT